MTTNANSNLIAAILADARVGTFTGLVTTKVGKTVGKGADKKVYGNDTVHAVIFTGFRYDRLVQRSLDALPTIDKNDVIQAVAKRHNQIITLADVDTALDELKASYERTLAGTSESSTAHVYDPLVVDGETVRGARVYKCVAGTTDDDGNPRKCQCRNCNPADEKAPVPGTIYLQGLSVYQKVLTPAPNGRAPEPKSAPKTLAKNEITHRLPVSNYVSFRLIPGEDWILRAGGTAAVEATEKGFTVDDSILTILDKAA